MLSLGYMLRIGSPQFMNEICTESSLLSQLFGTLTSFSQRNDVINNAWFHREASKCYRIQHIDKFESASSHASCPYVEQGQKVHKLVGWREMKNISSSLPGTSEVFSGICLPLFIYTPSLIHPHPSKYFIPAHVKEHQNNFLLCLTLNPSLRASLIMPSHLTIKG